MISDLNMKELKIAEAIKRTGDLVEIKVDGTAMTYNGKDIQSDRDIVRSDRFPQVMDEIRRLDWEVRGEMAIPGLGHTVHDVSKKDNWPKARLYIFSILSIRGKDLRNADPFEVRGIIDETFRKNRFRWLTYPLRFNSVKEGWDFVKARGAEGLVLKTLNGTFKVKDLKEAKLPVIGFEPGKQKGAFLVRSPNGAVSKVSGTAVAFLDQYQKMIASGEQPYIEIEYPNLTVNGIPFQPRLRRMGTLQSLQVG